MQGELQTTDMSSGKENHDSAILRSRLERVLREKEFKKSNRSFNANEEGNDFKGDNGTVEEGQNLINEDWINVEQLFEGIIEATVLNDYKQNVQKGKPPKQRLLVVANRLPVGARRKGEDSWKVEVNVGGLVSALMGIDEFEVRWIGWVGVNVPDETGQKSLTRALAEKRCIPVFLDEEIVHQYYNGYCNNILWTLFHYLGLPQEDRLATTRSFQSQFDAYKRANKIFADVFPIGIDPDRFIKALELPQVKDEIQRLKEKFSNRKVMLGVDRLDTMKGIPQKILAFEKFLEENPNWHDRVVLIQIAVPTRTDVPEYQKLTCQVHEIVGHVNGKYGTLTAVPLHHLDQTLDFHKLCALYAVTDVALVTSLRDGMNLVSYEYVACQASKKGVLILSEFAGAAQSLGAGAILVNPWNITEVAASISYALNMPDDEREKRHDHNFMHVTTHTSQQWAENFLSELEDTVAEAQRRTKQIPPPLPSKDVVESFSQTNNRLLILGFYATLTEQLDAHGIRIDQFKEMQLQLHPDLKDPLKKLCDDPRTTVVVLSGSDRSVLDENFGEFNMWLAAEHGMFLRSTQGEWMTTMPECLQMDWVDSVKHVFEYFTERTPRSYFELRETSLVWNYKYTDIEFGKLQSKDMLQHLWTGPISNASVEVVQGGRSVEVRAAGVTKGASIDRILGEILHRNDANSPIDHVLCIGHFLPKDEDIYTFFEPELSALPASTARISSASPVSGVASNHPAHKIHHPFPSPVKNISSNMNGNDTGMRGPTASVLDLNSENYISCTVGRKRSNARYLLNSSADVVSLLEELAESLNS
uniref:Uncharacterized protein n=1 Tax=Daucus carota subsp. sativus TaxID=79200 RepID=A0A162B8C4_DAUCS